MRYFAAVCSVAIVTRAALLPDEAGHPRAGERYYRLGLGPVQRLPFVVPSRRLRRISFIPTTAGQLWRARDVAELWRPLEDAAEGWDALWSAGVNQRR